jgi:N-glycosylase/DNA lyase
MMGVQLQEIRVKDFDIRHTFESAQPLTFYADYDYADSVLTYPSGTGMITALFRGNSADCRIAVHNNSVVNAKEEITSRFRLRDDMKRVYRRIGTDRFVRAAIKEYRGLRLTLNDPWETTLCFIVSQLNNVKRITMIVHNIINAFGNPIIDDTGVIAGKEFPKCEDMLGATEKKLMTCGAGFRAKYLMHAAEYCTNNLELDKLKGRSYGKIKEQLMEMPGIGDKVADCIALMGYGKLEAFPIDVWVKRTLEREYFNGEKKRMEELHEFAEERFGALAGYAEQYIYWYGRQMRP